MSTPKVLILYDIYTEKPRHRWDADLAFKDVNSADYAAVVIPGGRAPEYIRNDHDVQRTIRHFFDQEKPIAQLRNAPLAVAAAGVLKGRRTAAFPALEPDVTAAGATYVDADAVVDGEIVSARAWPDHPSWMREFLRILQKKAPVSEREAAGVR